MKKPEADLPTRKRNLALLINGIGLVAILALVAACYFWYKSIMGR